MSVESVIVDVGFSYVCVYMSMTELFSRDDPFLPANGR